MSKLRHHHSQALAAGVVTLEFAILASAFFLVIFMLIDLGGVMFRYVSLSEAARKGVRLASVCDINDKADIVTRMQAQVPSLLDANVNLSYLKANGVDACTSSADCVIVTVSLSNLSYDINTPAGTVTVNLPNFATSIVRESMDSTKNNAC